MVTSPAWDQDAAGHRVRRARRVLRPRPALGGGPGLSGTAHRHPRRAGARVRHLALGGRGDGVRQRHEPGPATTARRGAADRPALRPHLDPPHDRAALPQREPAVPGPAVRRGQRPVGGRGDTNCGRRSSCRSSGTASSSAAAQFMLGIKDASPAPGAPVWQLPADGTPAQDFSFEDAGNGFFYIRSHVSNLYLTLQPGRPRQRRPRADPPADSPDRRPGRQGRARLDPQARPRRTGPRTRCPRSRARNGCSDRSAPPSGRTCSWWRTGPRPAWCSSRPSPPRPARSSFARSRCHRWDLRAWKITSPALAG